MSVLPPGGIHEADFFATAGVNEYEESKGKELKLRQLALHDAFCGYPDSMNTSAITALLSLASLAQNASADRPQYRVACYLKRQKVP
jgi:hypothetical protein